MVNDGRNLLFISHANPEDNLFSRWLSLRLATEGYRVWCDLTRLLGGEDFWEDIESALRTEGGKLIFVLSRSSNHKPGPLQELQIGLSVARAHDLRDFVIPVRLDDLPHGEINIQLGRLNAIDCNQGWSQGLSALLKKLEIDGVEKDPRFSPKSVATWWGTLGTTQNDIIKSPEEYLSNWFPIRQLPESLYLHSVATRTWRPPASKAFAYPIRRHRHLLVSFASGDDLRVGIPAGVRIIKSNEVSVHRFVKGISQPTLVSTREANNIVVSLLGQGWDRFVESAGLSRHQMSNRSVVRYAKDGLIHRNTVLVPRELGVSRRRQVVGYRSLQGVQGGENRRRFWHFAFEAKPAIDAFRGYKLIPHLLFSDDGLSIWKDSDRHHRARRRESKNWWNPVWRDRTLGLVNWLAGYGEYIEVKLGSEASVRVETRPILFTSPIAYTAPDAEQPDVPDRPVHYDDLVGQEYGD